MNVLTKIQKHISSVKFTRQEKKRLYSNLETVYQRLIKRDYKRYSYSENKFNVLDRAEDFFVELEFYTLLGKNWAAFLKEAEVNKFRKVIDLCPGYLPKVELGLFYLGYSGEVVTLNNDKKSLDLLQKSINFFNPNFKLTKKVMNIFENKSINCELVLANHILDDLVLYYFSKKKGVSLKSIYEKEGELIMLWSEIIGNTRNSLEEVLPILVEVFSKVVKKDGYLYMAEYKSYVEKMLGINGAYRFKKRLFKELIEELTEKGFVIERGKLKRVFKHYKGHFTEKDCIILRKVK